MKNNKEPKNTAQEENVGNQKPKLAFITYRHIRDTLIKDLIIGSDGHYRAPDKTGETVYETVNYEIHTWDSTDLSNLRPGPDYDERKSRTRIRLVDEIFSCMQPKIKDFDHVFLYVGNKEGLDMIDLARGLSQEKVTYVMCDCKMDEKLRRIRHIGHTKPEIVECKCEDYFSTLERILDKYI